MSLTTTPLLEFVPSELNELPDPQRDLPRIARDSRLMTLIDAQIGTIPTHHRVAQCDARKFANLEPESVHLVLTSPPYWTLKQYNVSEGQLGEIEDYDAFLGQLDLIWQRCFDALVPGGRLICVVGDVCLSRRENNGRHTVVPLHASIQERCRTIGFDNLAPIIWYKIANAAYEVEGGGGTFLGKPYEPNAVIKNDIEYILMQRKPGGYRKVDVATRTLSLVSADNHKRWFQQIWTDVAGAQRKDHPAPYPFELAHRLIRMFSFVGDTVYDPFLGTGTTSLAAARCGRNSVGTEIDPVYFKATVRRLRDEASAMFSNTQVTALDCNG